MTGSATHAKLPHVALTDLRFLEHAPHRHEFASPAFEGANALAQQPLVTRERQTFERRQRVHHDDQVGWPQCVDEGFERALQPLRNLRVRVDVIVVEE
jgi:hypothetical protein